jgi:hypothetical protein
MGFRAFQAFADPARSGELHSNGTWRSPVAHLNGVQGVAGSNPAVPIEGPRSGISRSGAFAFVRPDR